MGETIWQKKINDDAYELYHADVETTFALINNKYYKGNNYEGIRIAGNFTAKHLPWYVDYIKNNIPVNEVQHWKKITNLLLCYSHVLHLFSFKTPTSWAVMSKKGGPLCAF